MFNSIIKISLIIVLFTNTILLFAGDDKNHHAAVFVGATSNLYAKHTDFTIGLDYEYRLNKFFGVGFIGDYVMADKSETLLMAGLFYHPIASLKLYTGNGIAIVTEVEEDTQHNENEGEEKSVSYYAFRLGTGYDFHITNFSITPTISWDLINGHSSIVYGLSFGIGF